MKPTLITFPKIQDNRGEFNVLLDSKIINTEFKQINMSTSRKGVVRGLHYQVNPAQSKLVYCISGVIQDIVVDIKTGEVYSYIIDGRKNKSVYVPENYLHGFAVLSDSATVMYLTSTEYNPSGDRTVYPLDPDLNINWMIDKCDMILSDKDKNAQSYTMINRRELWT